MPRDRSSAGATSGPVENTSFCKNGDELSLTRPVRAFAGDMIDCTVGTAISYIRYKLVIKYSENHSSYDREWEDGGGDGIFIAPVIGKKRCQAVV